jgi:hypothetical protein
MSIPSQGCYEIHDMCVCVCVIIITIFNVVSTTCVTYCVYSNIQILAFLERSLEQVKCTMCIPESLIQFYLYHVKKMCNVGFMDPTTPSQFWHIFLVEIMSTILMPIFFC